MSERSTATERIAIIADDLTGANDTAVQFWKRGFATVVMVGDAGLEEALSSAEVVALNLDSRIDPPDVAARKVREAAAALRSAGVRHIYKKIDSTLRGNIGAETDALLDEMGIPAAVITPAFPATNRAVVGGYLVVNGVLVTEVVRDERVSAARGSLPSLLCAQSQYPVASLELPDVSTNEEMLAEAMRLAMRGGARLLAADASTEGHLHSLVRAAAAAGTGGLLVGSGGLAGALAAQLAEAAGKTAPAGASLSGPASAAGSVLVVAGSYSAVTARQVEVAVDGGAPLVRLDLAKALSDSGEESAAAVQAAIAGLRAFGRAVVRPAGGHVPGAELRIAEILANIGQQALDSVPLSGLALTGGDIATATCRLLGATSIAVIGEVAPGLPAGQLQGGTYAGLRVVTKAGAFGAEDALQKAIQFLSAAE